MIVSNFSKGKIVSMFKSGSKDNSMSKNKKASWWMSVINVTSNWLLATGLWNDGGVWDDTAFWNG